MHEWAWSDPAELRIRMEVALEYNAAPAAEVAELRERLRAAESALLSAPPFGVRPAIADTVPCLDAMARNVGPPCVDASSPIEAKIALFRSLFAGRDDVYARRWTSARTGRSGWSPAEADPFNRALDDTDRTFSPLTDKVVFDHLSRQQFERDDVHVGLYPMLPDGTTRLLVADFDGKDGSDWRADAAAFAAACRQLDVPAVVEVSRSGAGAHVWVFFTAPVDAAAARAMGLGVLRKAMDLRAGLSLASYDRLFPSHDFLPVNARGGSRFGNLIALPLHGASRGRDHAVLRSGHLGAVSGPVRVSVRDSAPDAAARAGVGIPAGGFGRWAGAGRVRHAAAPAPLRSGPGSGHGAYGRRSDAARRHRRAAVATTGRAQARGGLSQPGVLPQTETAFLHLQHPASDPLLRRHRSRAPGAAPWPAGSGRRAHCRRGRRVGRDRRPAVAQADRCRLHRRTHHRPGRGRGGHGRTRNTPPPSTPRSLRPGSRRCSTPHSARR